MRLIRMVLILTGAAVLMPAPPEELSAKTAGMESTQISAVEMLSSATSTFSDVAGFCSRQPGACQTAAYVAAHLQAKAKYSVRLVYEWATQDKQPDGRAIVPVQVDNTDDLQTGSNITVLAKSDPPAGQSTLRLDDLIPVWRGPLPAANKG